MRFVNLNTRANDTPINQLPFSQEYKRKFKHTKWNFHKWKGLTLMKDPMTLSIYMMMMQEIKPKTILEFGTYDGGSALWMSDIMKSIACDCDVHTFDINVDRVNIPKNSKITFHSLDNNEILKFVSENYNLFEQIESPVLAIEDSHVNTNEIIKCIDPFLSTGDYLVIEDTLAKEKYEEVILSDDGINKLNYKVDTFYCDFWGFNNSWNVNSIFKKF